MVLECGEWVELMGFGSFGFKKCRAGSGQLANRVCSIEVQVERVMCFKVGKEIEELVNGYNCI